MICIIPSNDKKNFQLKIKAIAGSSQNAIKRIENNELVIKINAQREKGKANKELIKYISEISGCPKTEIQIKTGETSNHKIIVIPIKYLKIIEELIKDI